MEGLYEEESYPEDLGSDLLTEGLSSEDDDGFDGMDFLEDDDDLFFDEEILPFIESDSEARSIRRRYSPDYYRRLKRRRLLARRLAAKRAARNHQRYWPPSGANGVKKKIVQAQNRIERVDIENKLNADTLNSRVVRNDDRIDRNERVLAMTMAIEELRKTYPDLLGKNQAVQSLLNAVPTLYLKPDKIKDAGSLLMDPRFIAALPAIFSIGKMLLDGIRNKEAEDSTDTHRRGGTE